MPDDALFAQRHEGGERLAADLVQVCKFDVVDVDQVDIIDPQPLHALIDAFAGPLRRIVPAVAGLVAAVAADFRGEDELLPRELPQGLAEDLFGPEVAVVGGDVDEVDAAFDGGENGPDAVFLPQGVEDAAEAGSAESEGGQAQAGAA